MKSQDSALIEAKNLTKVYSRRNSEAVKAIDDVNLKVFPGEMLALVGCSGSGKTTLLNLLGALDRPTHGEIMFRGKGLCSLSARDLTMFRRQEIGFIFQTFNLLSSLTVSENVESALIHSGISKETAQQRVSSTLKILELHEFAERHPFELSVGQRQRVAIARAIVKGPSLILADEPTGEMDPISGKKILQILIELKRKSGVTLLVASHGTSFCQMADRIVFLRAGRIVSQVDAGY